MTFEDQSGKQKRLRMNHFLTIPSNADWQASMQEFADEGIFLDRKNRCTYLNCCQHAQHVEMKRTSIFEAD